jgi:tetratricopeptide (TPR) repeat protein
MRRLPLSCLLPLILMTASTRVVFGDDLGDWIGHDVMVKASRYRPRSGGRVAPRAIVCVRTAKQVKGDWLSVGDGWVRRSEVVPLEDAVGWFTAQIEKRPSAFDYVSRGAARCVQGDYEGAAEDCAAALRINPRLDYAYYHRAAALAKQERFEEAIGDYDAALRLNPRLVGAYVDRGAARLKLGDYRRSLVDVNNALRLSPREPDAHYVRGIARSHLQQYRGAVADLNVALRANPDRATAYDIRGACKEQLGQQDEAIKDYDKAIQLDPTNVSAHSHRDRLRMARATTK